MKELTSSMKLVWKHCEVFTQYEKLCPGHCPWTGEQICRYRHILEVEPCEINIITDEGPDTPTSPLRAWNMGTSVTQGSDSCNKAVCVI